MAQRKIIVLLSGQIASGKTTLSKKLEEKFNFKYLRTRSAIKNLAEKELKGREPDRSFLQKFGTSLDTKDNGKWVLNYFQKDLGYSLDEGSFYIVDAVRVLKQIEHFRKAYSYTVCHIHL